MSGDQLVIEVPDDPDGKVIHVAGVTEPLRLRAPHARLLHQQLGAVLAALDAAPTPPARGSITDRQRGYILALMGEYGITQRENRLTAMSKIVGRPVRSTNHLSSREASKVIEVMKTKVGPTAGYDPQEPF